MRDDFDPTIDFDVEGRLRRISRDPQPPVPARLFRLAEEVADGAPVGFGGVKLERLRTPAIVPGPVRKALIGLAATLVLAMAGTALFVAVRPNKAASTPSASWPWTALEWRELPVTAFPEASSPLGPGIDEISVIEWQGRVLVHDSRDIWSSTDGTHWKHLAANPGMVTLRATKNWLLDIGASCWRDGWCFTGGGPVGYSTDGVTWRNSEFPTFDITGVATTDDRALLLARRPGAVHDLLSTTIPYVSVDGASWQTAKLPSDMAGALNLSVTSGRAGFVVSGIVPDPNGSEQLSGTDSAGSYSVKGFYRYWYSADGLAWTDYELSGMESTFGGQLSIYRGSAGDAFPMISYHSLDGLSWTRDESSVLRAADISEASTDGNEILAQGDGPTFYVSRGDGYWQALQNGGDVGSLPQGGESWVAPGGVIYVAQDRIFYGAARSGETPARTLAPGPTVFVPTLPPGPTLAPLPSVSQAPAVRWSRLTGFERLGSGPSGAASVAGWEGGYVAVRNAPAGGGGLTAWTSPDGKTWRSVPDGAFTGTSGVAAAAGKSVLVATWNEGNGVWMSNDGSSWASIGGPPIGDRAMAGDSRGLVAVADDPQYQLFYFGGDTGGWYPSSLQGADANSVRSVALSGDRWVAVGGWQDQTAALLPTAWTSENAASWTRSSISAAPGQRFVSVVAGRTGFLAASMKADDTGPITLWSSHDGSTWHQLESGKAPGPDARIAGDGTHLVGCQIDAGTLHCWVSIDAEHWMSLAMEGDLGPLVAAGPSLRVFPLRDGMLFVTDDGAWYAAASD
jgi:hypothetical protein